MTELAWAPAPVWWAGWSAIGKFASSAAFIRIQALGKAGGALALDRQLAGNGAMREGSHPSGLLPSANATAETAALAALFDQEMAFQFISRFHRSQCPADSGCARRVPLLSARPGCMLLDTKAVS